MERNYYNEGFESFLREKSDEYKLYPSDKVWRNINRRLHPRKKWPYLAAALLLLGIGVGTKWQLDDSTKTAKNNMEQLDATGSVQSYTANPDKLVLDDAKNSNANPEGSDGPSLTVASRNPLAGVSNADKPAMQAIPGGQLIPNESSSSATIEIEETKAIDDLSPEGSWTIQHRPMARLSPVQKTSRNLMLVEGPSRLEVIKSQIGNISKRTSWQIYVSPTVSYRNLVGKTSKTPNQATGSAVGAAMGLSRDVSDAVRHRPSIGMEIGTALLYPVSKNFRIKAGLQFNYNNYLIEAFSYKPEMATFSAAGPGAPRPVSTMSYYRNYNGYDKTTLQNKHFMISTPIGFELTVAGNEKVKFNVASTLQPTYVISNQSYLVSTNLKNYAQESSLYRKWNMNAGMEAFLSMSSGSYTWVIGPQFRYQMFSSYKNKYPIQEHLIDMGFKVGVNKRLK